MNKTTNPPKKQKGQSLVEFAVTVTILLILIAGIVDLGRAFFDYVGMRDGAQETALWGSAYPLSCAGILQHGQNSLQNVPYDSIEIFLNGKQCGVDTILTTDACAGNEILVTVRNSNFPITTPFIGTIVGGQSISLSTTIRDHILRPPCNP